MAKLSKDTSGFTTVEGLLVIVTLAVIGIGGYFVAKHVDRKTPVASISSSTSSSSVVKISQLGIQFTIPASLEGVTYDYATNSSNNPIVDSNGSTEYSVVVSTRALTNADPACAAGAQGGADNALGSIIKGTGRWPSSVNPSSDLGSYTFVKQFPNYWIAYAAPQDSCSTKSLAQNIQSKDQPILQTAIKTVQPTP